MIRFGSAGNPEDFYQKGFKNSEEMPKYLAQMGLDAYEYECSRGVRVSEQKANKIRQESKKYNISLSVHAPYYISLSTQEPEKQEKTVGYILDTMKVAKQMGASKIVVHAGALLGLEREFAVKSACQLLKKAMERADKIGLGEIRICPETMGKINQLGDSKEIIQMCQVDNRFFPTIDFGHLYCRSLGKLISKKDWKEELKQYLKVLGYDRMKHFHAHFSKMEYTKGGEKRHVTFANKECGPDFSVIAEVLKELELEPSILCESAGTQSIDAKEMKQIYYGK